MQKKDKIKDFIFLHFALIIYSFAAIFSKLASKKNILSFDFFIFYGLLLTCLFVYAILWQQVLKKVSLTTAFANRSVVIIWGIVWGCLLFSEKIHISNIIGAIVIIVGIYFVVVDNG